jgi:NAD(P)-dependent dehydrogenase (short-subunit alcohol dehydrogenase family)
LEVPVTTRLDPTEFVGKVAIVAGGSLGIGRAAARRLAAGGAAVVLCGRRPEHVAATTAEIRDAGGAVVGIEADVSRRAEAERLVATAVERFGGLDLLVNSQGVQRYGTVVETSDETWDEVMSVNLKSMFLVSRAAIPEMRKRDGGAIVLVSSVQGFATQKGVAAYSTSKAAINGLARAMALDHAAEGIRVNAVCPASVDTPMLRWSADLFKGTRSREAILRSWGGMHPVGRIGEPEEVAELIAFLLSERAAFVTGGEYKIDGGMMAQLGVALPES